MLTLDEAKKIQKERERKTVLKFLIICSVVEAVVISILHFSEMFSLNSGLWVVPAAALIIVFNSTGMNTFFSPKIFSGGFIFSL